MSERKKELPVSVPIFAAYHQQGSCGVAMAANPGFYNFYLHDAVDMMCGRNFLHGMTTPEFYVCNTAFGQNPCVDQRTINLKFVMDLSHELIRRMIDMDYYVYFDGIDDFYVEGKSWYGKRHFSHDGMICGYDDEKQTYDLFAYDENWVYRVFSTSQSSFYRGLSAGAPLGKYGNFVGLKVRDGGIAFDVKLVYQRLEKYLDSDFEKYPTDGIGTVYGTVVHDYLCIYLERLRDGVIPYERMDWRAMRVLWEHKKCMLDRIKSAEAAIGAGVELSSEYEAVVRSADLVRMLYTRYHLKKDDHLPDAIIERIRSIKEDEKRILTELCERIKRFSE